MIMNSELTEEQIAALEGMISRRMQNTQETRKEACEHIAQYITQSIKSIK